MNLRILTIIAVAILIVISFLYIQQGGIKNVDVKVVDTEERFMIGIPFEGNISSEEFKSMFAKIKQIKSDYHLKGDLSTLYYNDPQKSKGDIKAFFGVISDSKPSEITNLKILIIPKQRYVQGSINASVAFVNKTYNAIFDFAEDNNIQLEEEYLEWFPSEKQIVVQIKTNNDEKIKKISNG